MMNALGLGFLKYLGGFTLVMVLLIILASLVGGITYDTSDRSWGGWDFSMNFHFGDGMKKLRELREERGRLLLRRQPEPEQEQENPEFNLPNRGRPLFKPLRRLLWWMPYRAPARHDNQVSQLLGGSPTVPVFSTGTSFFS